MNGDTILRSSNVNLSIPQAGSSRNVPLLPPRPSSSTGSSGYVNNFGAYGPYQSPYSSYGYNSFNTMPYRGMGFGSFGYGNFGNYNTYGVNNYNSFAPTDDAERRFIQYAEERSRSAFASVESVVRTISSVSMMLDNTFFAMISSFRAILGVAESFGHMRNMFGQIWHSISLYRLFNWLYRKIMSIFGFKVANAAVNVAWNEVTSPSHAQFVAANDTVNSSWPTLAFFGILMSAPYIISKLFLPKYQDRYNPEKWKNPGVRAKAAFDFVATNPNEMSLKVNDEILLAPTYIQEEMKLTNSGWALALGNGKSGLIPLNYIVFVKKNNGVLKSSRDDKDIPVPRIFPKRVSFGENQIIETNTSEPVIAISQAQKSADNSSPTLPESNNKNSNNDENNK
ncbi:peroxisomal membrane protein PEX13 [Agrilus planipennis]|uniref:Peroxisomal membrane protein PEX13 n=1 Tax=Agrilus planipennis TaxID=224129 RepID=A0A1W4XNY1_AGRPL|nr:peroxisomal membrane protein PEX13 [Agrilus planipennis]XP_018334100.1 peroxisomal membrane protein PEX13 [Agrilus planipennis]